MKGKGLWIAASVVLAIAVICLIGGDFQAFGGAVLVAALLAFFALRKRTQPAERKPKAETPKKQKCQKPEMSQPVTPLQSFDVPKTTSTVCHSDVSVERKEATASLTSVLAQAAQKADVSGSGGSSFGSWDTSIHLAEGQLLRFGRAAYSGFEIKKFSHGIVKTIGSTGKTYYTSLDSCDCPDFEKRHLPCKHIYNLALKFGYSADDFYSSYLDSICADDVIPRPAVGYSNGVKKYQVHGVNPETKRRNKKLFFATSEEDAVSVARDAGLVDPIEVNGIAGDCEFVPVNSQQAEYAKEYKIAVPPSADYSDMQALLFRVANDDTSAVPVGLLKYATKQRLPCSLLIGLDDLLLRLVDKLPHREQIALYAAAVCCSEKGVMFANIQKNPVTNACYAFADFAYHDEKLYRNLLNYLTVSELKKPAKKSAPYRAVVKFMASHTAGAKETV